jgi:hypothetical protein
MEEIKTTGVTATERMLAEFCRKSFLSIWTYPNPYKDDKHELCDQLAVFGKHIFIFFDRNNALPTSSEKDPKVLWARWKRNVIDKQINTAHGAERYIKSRRKIYTDGKCTKLLPIEIDIEKMHFHKIIVAHGAKEACLNSSAENIYGSLGIAYCSPSEPLDYPFIVELDNSSPIHVFDSHNLPIILSELDTVTDLGNYLLEKEKTVKKSKIFTYCGEEDLLAHYYLNIHSKTKKHFIGSEDESINGFALGEGDWHEFLKSPTYLQTKKASKISYKWDEMIQRSCDNFEIGRLGGNSHLLKGRSPIFEMVKEPRFMRRSLAELMSQAIESFPDNPSDSTRHLRVMPSFFPETAYLFLQLKAPSSVRDRLNYREVRRHFLEVACGALKNKSPQYKNIVGIAIDAPKHYSDISEDFILMPCENWTENLKTHYEELNEILGFFKSPDLKEYKKTFHEFVPNFSEAAMVSMKKIGRNDPCKCGSNLKYKKCCGK